ncbi:MAG: transglutaminase-like domain-containing protein [Candidatus Thorarchaeota archaeon]
MRLRIEMQADILNRGRSKIRDGRLIWHLFTDMGNQFVEMIDVFPPARVKERAEKNIVAVMKVPEISPGESFSPTAILRIDTTSRDWLIEKQSIPESVKKQTIGMYSSMQKYWEIDNPAIQSLSQSIAEKSDGDSTFGKLAFQVVREQVKLKTHLDERRGAARAAVEKEGDCDEHADLFIALTRAVKIPSRRVIGHFFKGTPEPEPHAWCEMFLEDKGWIPVDPALGRFGILSENYFSRIREGLVSQRPTIQLKTRNSDSGLLSIEENVTMAIVKNSRI